ncbi:MAG: hypothetical protein K2X27_04895 [Candidatus Obscuribacterales bacterium]|nr:hypothetical protein [Candidatus Obscuribacterales bacterium]
MEYHLIDHDHIEIIAGDLRQGVWKFASGFLTKDGESAVPLEKNLGSIEVRLKRQVSNLDTVSDLPLNGLMGAAFSTLLGPIGGLASSAVGMVAGKGEFLCLGCHMKDGRKFIAYMRTSLFEQWKKFADKVVEKDE